MSGSGPNFTAANFGTFDELTQYAFQVPGTDRTVEGKVFLNIPLGLTGAEISLNRLPPGAGLPFLHRHNRNEEIFVFVRGHGEMLVDGTVIRVKEGSVVRIAPAGERTWRNNGTEPLEFLVIQVTAGSFEGHTTLDGVAVAHRPEWPAVRPHTGAA